MSGGEIRALHELHAASAAKIQQTVLRQCMASYAGRSRGAEGLRERVCLGAQEKSVARRVQARAVVLEETYSHLVPERSTVLPCCPPSGQGSTTSSSQLPPGPVSVYRSIGGSRLIGCKDKSPSSHPA